ncbi:MAG: hypothetical protein ABFE07_28965 [Armatimonadia bacterium]
MRIKVEVWIEKCYYECPHFGLEHGAMYCKHPNIQGVYGGYIIEHPDCDTGFPKDCPLIRRQPCTPS